MRVHFYSLVYCKNIHEKYYFCLLSIYSSVTWLGGFFVAQFLRSFRWSILNLYESIFFFVNRRVVFIHIYPEKKWKVFFFKEIFTTFLFLIRWLISYLSISMYLLLLLFFRCWYFFFSFNHVLVRYRVFSVQKSV